MDSLTVVALTVIVLIAILLVLFWSGFMRKFEGFYPDVKQAFDERIMIPETLPDNAKEHYRTVFKGNQINDIHTALVWGKAKYKISGIWMPLRFQTFYQTGAKFVRHLEFFWHNKIILKGIDYYAEGTGLLDVNGIVRMNERGEMVDESQWISLWAESLLISAIDLSDSRLSWKKIDAFTADMIITDYLQPNVTSSHTIRIKFHPDTGLIHSIAAERYRGQSGKKRIPWRIQVRKWHRRDTMWLPEYTVMWEDQKKPWCQYVIEGISYNAAEDSHFMISPKPVEKKEKKTGVRTRKTK
jgi:hypothetical protein